MTKTFTPDDVIRYLYNEIPLEEKDHFENALLCDQKLLDLFNDLSLVKDGLDAAQKAPSEKTVRNIMDYSKSLNLHFLKE